MISIPPGTRVYLAEGATDMRKAINGLSVQVETKLQQSALSGHLFVFCNRARTIVKALYWDHNGFCLWQKRLESERFRWPRSEAEVLEKGGRRGRVENWLVPPQAQLIRCPALLSAGA